VEVSRIGIPGGSGQHGKDPVGTTELKEIGIPIGHGATGKAVPGTGVESRNSADNQYLDWRNKLLPKSIDQEFPEPIRYRQVFEDRLGFIPHLSILDLLFCEGRRTVEILESSKIPI